MSSTGRGAVRMAFDYYVTPVPDILCFLRAWLHDDDEARAAIVGGRVLDPCAGGNSVPVVWEYKPAKNGKPAKVFNVPPTPMSYPTAIRQLLGEASPEIVTNDIRPDSPAQLHVDYLTTEIAPGTFDAVITNPPFWCALEIIKRSLLEVRVGGYVVMLQRLNFMGAKSRRTFFRTTAPNRTYVGDRMSFTPDGEQDSIEYAHFVWRRGSPTRWSRMCVV